MVLPTMQADRAHAVVCALAIALPIAGGLAVCEPVPAAVVVLTNRTQQTVRFIVQAADQQPLGHELAPGRLIPLPVADSVRITFGSAGKRCWGQLDPNTLHVFSSRSGEVRLKQVVFSQSRSGLWRHQGPGQPSPVAVVVPVKILVDDEQPALPKVWEARLRKQIAVASKIIEQHCGVRFEVTAVQTWQSDAAAGDLRRIADDFRQKVSPEPAALAIGFTSQYQIPHAQQVPRLQREPLCTHIVLPDVQGKFRNPDQADLLMRELGHFLGATRDPGADLVGRVERSGGNAAVGNADAAFDPVNTLVMNLIAEQIRARGARSLSDVPRSTRQYLHAIYSQIAREFPKDPDAGRLAALVRDPLPRQGVRYRGGWDDGMEIEAQEVTSWQRTDSRPMLGERAMFDGQNPIRWLLDGTLPVPGEPGAMVEFVGGDQLPGKVVEFCDGTEASRKGLPPHLLVAPDARLDWPDGPARSHVRVTARWVRRIVWQRVAAGYRPGTLFFNDGRQLDFRSVRFDRQAIRLLREEGIREVPLGHVAELHLPAVDPWEAYFEQLAALSADGRGRLMQLETADGLRVTGSIERFQARSHGDEKNPDHWYHLVQPAWSLEAFWLRHRQIRLRRYWMPHEVPLTRIEPGTGPQQSDLGGAWGWQLDRNVQGGPLTGGGRQYHWGFGVHAPSQLEFPLPPGARSFRTRLGLDGLAGAGGCVQANVFAGSNREEPLFASPVIVGSADVLDTGPLPLEGPAASGQSLVLQVDPAHHKRPRGADPFDVRDIFDWFEPQLDLDPRRLRAEVFRRAPRLVAAWRNWTVKTGRMEGARLVSFPDQSDSLNPAFRLMATAGDGPIAVSGKLRVSAGRDRLLVAVSRPDDSSPSTIEVRVEGKLAGKSEVPVRNSPEGPDPLIVSLAEHHGRRVDVEVIQRGRDDRSLVQWCRLALVGRPGKTSGAASFPPLGGRKEVAVLGGSWDNKIVGVARRTGTTTVSLRRRCKEHQFIGTAQTDDTGRSGV